MPPIVKVSEFSLFTFLGHHETERDVTIKVIRDQDSTIWGHFLRDCEGHPSELLRACADTLNLLRLSSQLRSAENHLDYRRLRHG